MDEVENTPYTLIVMIGQSLAGQTEPTSSIPHPLVFYKHVVKEYFPLIAWDLTHGIAWDLYDVFSQEAGENRVLRDSEKILEPYWGQKWDCIEGAWSFWGATLFPLEGPQKFDKGGPIKCTVQAAKNTETPLATTPAHDNILFIIMSSCCSYEVYHFKQSFWLAFIIHQLEKLLKLLTFQVPLYIRCL